MTEEWFSHMDLSTSGFVVGNGDDVRIWDLDPQGIFSVKSLCSKFMRVDEAPRVNPKIWKGVKVKVFGWLTCVEKILTIHKLRFRRMMIVNSCPLCLSNAKSVNHLLFRCRFASKI